jgi:hypothetical protein
MLSAVWAEAAVQASWSGFWKRTPFSLYRVSVQSVCGEPAGVGLALGVGVEEGEGDGSRVAVEVAVAVAEATAVADRGEAGVGAMVAEGAAPAQPAVSAINAAIATAARFFMYSLNGGAPRPRPMPGTSGTRELLS